MADELTKEYQDKVTITDQKEVIITRRTVYLDNGSIVGDAHESVSVDEGDAVQLPVWSVQVIDTAIEHLQKLKE